MPIKVEQSVDMKAGHVRLRRPDDKGFDPGSLEIDIATADARHLDPSGAGASTWSPSETWLRPDSSLVDDGVLVLELGPWVAWNLKPNTGYRVTFRDGHNRRVEDLMSWPGNVRLPSSPPTPTPKRERPEPPPDTASVPEPPVPEADVAISEAAAETAPATPAPPVPAERAEEDAGKDRGSSKRTGIYVLVVVVLLVLAVLLYLFKDRLFETSDIDETPLGESSSPAADTGDGVVPDEAGVESGAGESGTQEDAGVEADTGAAAESGADDSEQEAPTSEQTADDQGVSDETGAEGGTDDGGAQDETGPQTGADSAAQPGADTTARGPLTREQTIVFLKEKPPAAGALEESLRSGAAGEGDAAFLLLKYAARTGSPEAARRMGQLYDPATHSAEGGVVSKPDPEIAADWYGRAAEAGDVDAMVRLGEMLRDGTVDRPDASEQADSWLRKAAEAGSERAKELLQ